MLTAAVQTYRPIAQDEATRCKLPVDLILAVVQVESAGKPGATRYEPAFYTRYVAPLKLTATEGTGRATSWGLMQVMGQTARTLGYTQTFKGLLVPVVGIHWGCELLMRLRDRYPDEPWEVICRAYNGGPGNRHNLANKYPSLVLKALGGVWPE